MKYKKLTLFLFCLLLAAVFAGCGSEKDDSEEQAKEDAERIASIKEKAEALYNEDKNDLAEGLTMEQINEVVELIMAEIDKEFSPENESELLLTYDLTDRAKSMFELDNAIHSIFEKDDILAKDVTLDTIEDLKESLEIYRALNEYYERLTEKIEVAFAQAEHVELVMSYFESFIQDGEIIADVTEQDVEEAEELLKEIKNNEIRKELTDHLYRLVAAVETIEETEYAAENKDDSSNTVRTNTNPPATSIYTSSNNTQPSYNTPNNSSVTHSTNSPSGGESTNSSNNDQSQNDTNTNSPDSADSSNSDDTNRNPDAGQSVPSDDDNRNEEERREQPPADDEDDAEDSDGDSNTTPIDEMD